MQKKVLPLQELSSWWTQYTPQRILVVGSSNAGKSTLAHHLQQITGLPCFEIDDLAWQPGWRMHELPVLREKISQIVSHPQWILVGNYGSTQDISWPKADLVIWLDLPKYVVMWRVLWRTCKRIGYRTPVCNGNYESFTRAFLERDSLILWVWNHFRSIRQRYHQRLQDKDIGVKPEWLHLTTSREVRQCEAAIKRVFLTRAAQTMPPESIPH